MYRYFSKKQTYSNIRYIWQHRNIDIPFTGAQFFFAKKQLPPLRGHEDAVCIGEQSRMLPTKCNRGGGGGGTLPTKTLPKFNEAKLGLGERTIYK